MNQTTVTVVCLTLLTLPPACASAGRKPRHRKVRVARKPSHLKSVPSTLVLKITAKKTRLKVKEYARITVTIRNRGGSAVTLVQPGDGSRWGWRTPRVGWSVLPAKSPGSAHPRTPPLPGPRCGNVNRLKPKEVFLLRPGRTKKLSGWVGFPRFPGPGRYRLLFYYFNDPSIRWKGIPLGQHDPSTMQRVKTSTKASLISNELVFVVTR